MAHTHVQESIPCALLTSSAWRLRSQGLLPLTDRAFLTAQQMQAALCSQIHSSAGSLTPNPLHIRCHYCDHSPETAPNATACWTDQMHTYKQNYPTTSGYPKTLPPIRGLQADGVSCHHVISPRPKQASQPGVSFVSSSGLL